MSKPGWASIVVSVALFVASQVLRLKVKSMPEWLFVISYFIIAGLLGLGIYLLWPKSKKQQLLDMAQNMEETAAEISRFLSERKRYDPSIVPVWHVHGWDSWDEGRRHEEWNQSTQRMTGYFMETMNFYREQFVSRVIHLVEKATSFGYRDEKLERFYEHPVNTLGIEEIVSRLGALGKRIKDDHG